MQTTTPRSTNRPLRRARLLLCIVAAAALPAAAQTPPVSVTLDPVVVTATRNAERSFDVPASVDMIGSRVLHEGQPMVNLSETLVRVPGLVALNRQNYAQDLQISSRGFGARSTFGVRGIRLYQDDIPATMPDGQGQTGSFSLLSAQRIEVLRGPFSTLYGNAAGGVISVFTEDGTPRPELTLNGGAGSFSSWTAGAKLTGSWGDTMPGGYVAAVSRFSTDGYRDHSAAVRDLVNVKLTAAPQTGSRITILGSTQYQPESQDPLGLTRAQWQADPRAVDPSALLFDTRKTIRQQQGGATIDQAIGASTSLKLVGYGGARKVRQYLAFTGDTPTSSGGVTDLDRTYGGVGARLGWLGNMAGMPLRLTMGSDYDRQSERRRGFVNDFGALGALRRDEDDRVTSIAAYAQAEWSPISAASITAGVRHARVEFDSNDHYITAANPDDSGARRFSNTSPVLGVVVHASDAVNVYASYGNGFETPTLIELAYRRGGSGLNFDLQPATSRAGELGVKAILNASQRVNAAIFEITTKNEIVIDAATGGRTVYKNAGRTNRRGFEVAWDGRLAPGLAAYASYTYLRAVFDESFTTGASSTLVPAGNRLPGVPAHTGYAELAWSPAVLKGVTAAVEVQHTGAIPVNEVNSDAAPAVTLVNARLGYEHVVAGISLAEFVRVNNLGDRNYIGSVIVGDTNGRFFEPAPGRNWFAGVTARVAF